MTKTVTFTIEVPEDISEGDVKGQLEVLILDYPSQLENELEDWELSDFTPRNLTVY